MKKTWASIFIGAVISLSIASCGSKNESNDKAKENYVQSLKDSISIIQAEIDSCNMQLDTRKNEVEQLLRGFTTIANSREVAPYMIMTTAQNSYPLKNTGVIARINDSGQFEIVAALTGRTFNQISVTSGAETVTSATVPHDQALNYRTDTMNTVMFLGPQADAIGALVFDNELNPLTIQYLNGGGSVSYKITSDQAHVIAYTYQLYNAMTEMKKLEQRVPMLHQKLNVLRVHLDKRS